MLKGRTLRSILEDKLIADIAPDAVSNWNLPGRDCYDDTLPVLKEKMGWNTVERGFDRLFRAAQGGNYYFKLYTEAERRAQPDKERCNIVWFPSDDKGADDRPYILLVPGGGFVNVWNLTEGWPVGDTFNRLGYHVFILTYQVDVEAAALKAMGDVARALSLIRQRAAEFHVDPDRYITCGFSAGGYLVCLWNTEKGYQAFDLPKPEACFPIYAVTSFRLRDAGTWNKPFDKDDYARHMVGCTMREACESCFEIPEHVEGFPPSAIFVAAEDTLVDPAHSKRLAEGLRRAGIPCMIEIGPTGGHGFTDGTGMCMEGWPARALKWLETL